MIDHILCQVAFERDEAEEFDFPSWPCPICSHGHLRCSKEAVRHLSEERINFLIEVGAMEPYEDRGVFSAMMMCQNKSCEQGVAVLGHYWKTTPDGVFMSIPSQQIHMRTVCNYAVVSIHPPLRLISIPEGVPESIVDALRRSFALYWTDAQSCAAAIRVAIEVMADALKERRLDKNKKPVSFATHLEDLNLSHPKLVEASKLIKNAVGNPGAHGDPVERSMILTAYELLELELRSLFEAYRRKQLVEKLQPRKK